VQTLFWKCSIYIASLFHVITHYIYTEVCWIFPTYAAIALTNGKEEERKKEINRVKVHYGEYEQICFLVSNVTCNYRRFFLRIWLLTMNHMFDYSSCAFTHYLYFHVKITIHWLIECIQCIKSSISHKFPTVVEWQCFSSFFSIYSVNNKKGASEMHVSI